MSSRSKRAGSFFKAGENPHQAISRQSALQIIDLIESMIAAWPTRSHRGVETKNKNENAKETRQRVQVGFGSRCVDYNRYPSRRRRFKRQRIVCQPLLVRVLRTDLQLLLRWNEATIDHTFLSRLYANLRELQLPILRTNRLLLRLVLNRYGRNPYIHQ